MARTYDDDEPRPGGFWRFLKGMLSALILSAIVFWVMSVYILPPPVIPVPVTELDTGPEIVDGIVVSDEPAYSNTDQSTEPEPEAEPEPQGTASLEGPAMVVNAAEFAGDLQGPLVAVVLDDTSALPLLHQLLFSLDMPITVGVVAGGEGDVDTAEAARNAGFEVVAQLPIAPPGESGGSVLEYALPEEDSALRTLTLMQRMHMAVAVSRPLASVIPPDEPVLGGISGVVGPLGFAYLDHSVSPGSESSAKVSGLAEAKGALVEVSRHTIQAGASAAEAHAVLDGASADAAERGWAVVVAAPSEELVQALLLWAGEGEGGLAQLAPLTAVIRKQIGG